MRLLSILCLIFICSCAKHNKTSKSTTDRKDIPGFYNINFDSIFVNDNLQVNPKTKDIIKSYYHFFWEGNNLSGGFLVAVGDKIIFENYRGKANIEKNIDITENTPLHLASVSKTLTAMAILKLIESGKLKLNQSVSSIFPQFPYKNMTILDLLTHRSGLSNYAYYADYPEFWDKSKSMTNQDVLNLFSQCQPELLFPPNTQFSYSNTNYAILALIIEKITKKSYPEAMRIMIFEPLEMKNTFVFQPKDFSTVSLSYYNNGKEYPWDHLDLVYGDKNIYSTPRDMLQFSKAMYSPKFLRQSLMDSVFTGYSNERKGIKNYGLGFRMLNFDNGKKLTFHNGWWHGNNTVFVHLLDEKITIIALGNKKSNAVYSAFRLPSIFGDYPIPMPEEEMDENTKDSLLNLEMTIKKMRIQDSMDMILNKKNRKDTVLSSTN